MSSGYCGWRTYETWLVGVEIGSAVFEDQMAECWQREQGNHDSLGEHVENCAVAFVPELKETVEEMTEWGLAAGGEHTFARSLVQGSLREVDWHELSRAWFEDFADQFQEKWPALAIEEPAAV